MKNILLLIAQLMGCISLLTLPFDAVAAQFTGNRGVAGVFNVMNFGAKGDGSTDDTLAVQAAVNAAEQGPGCGTILFPTGDYVINSGPILIKNTGCLLRGEGGLTEGGTAGAVLITDTSGQDIVQVNGGSSGVLFPAPSFENLNFLARNNSRTQKLLDIINSNQGHVFHCSFYGGSAGIYLGGTRDASNWTIDGGSIFDDNVVGVDNAFTAQNIVTNGYIVNRQTGDIGVRWQAGTGDGRVTNMHFAPGGYANTGPAVWTAGNQTLIAFNVFESYAPAVVASHTGNPDAGFGTRIIANSTIGDCTGTHGYGSAWNIDPALASNGEPAVISLNTYECTTDTYGQ